MFPEYDLGVQLIPEEDEFKYDFDILDATKLWPEETIPVEIIGKLTLNRLVNNFFAEEEQSSFDPATLVPGIEFSNDPVLQGRALAYRDTDYHRLGTANINEIPVNRPICEVNTNHRDGHSKYRIDIDSMNFHQNMLVNNTPKEASFENGGYEYYPAKVEGNVTREFPSDSFNDYFSQARLFWNSLAPFERNDLVDTFVYHLQYVKNKDVRQRNVEMWANVDKDMANCFADNLGVARPQSSNVSESRFSPAISMANTLHSAATQKVAVLIGDGYDNAEVTSTLNVLRENDVFIDIIGEKLGTVTAGDGSQLKVEETIKTKLPVLYDAVYIVGGNAVNQGEFNKKVMEYYDEAFKHYKPIGIASTGESLVCLPQNNDFSGIVCSTNNDKFEDDFIAAITQKRFWDRSIYC